MASGPNYKVKFRRRREGKTNYYRRYVYVLSKATRLVIRITNKYVVAQIVKFDPKGDKTVVMAHSIELAKKFGWKGDTNNTSAAYLTGYLLGLRARKAGVESAVLDIGLFTPTVGSRIFYAAKGAVDAGLKLPLGEDLKFDEDRIKGAHVAEYASKLETENPEKFNRIFSGYLKRGLNPKDLVAHFQEVLNKIKTGEK
ncbi:MAG: 50S ribosomal protein L18 [Candidatus Aramenus sp.]|nr:50S ribosomal protein L18 [Candidatus Aramenus sp.]